ncbi:MAG: FecR family protein [Odoribacteraceae bacterium]|jgi:ferric-dicitrate binding protein FerR (iron transport regulator)|nr:FecR family protein [Odoribacteraceae bacterium]
MKIEMQIFELSRVIARHLAGEITDDERQYLDSWLAASSRHRELLERVRDEQLAREKLLVYERVDVEEALSRFLVEKHARSRRARFARFTRYAGSVALVVALAAIWLGRDREVAPVVDDDGPLLPLLASRVTLTTASGELLELPTTLSPEQQIGAGHLLKQDSGLTRILPVTRDESASYRVITVPRGGEFKILLGDGTKVWINAETKFFFPLEFTGDERRVKLEGEAYFEVAGDPSRAFIVETPRASVTVRGTSFNLSSGDWHGRTVATLVSGSVAFRVKESGEEIPMRPGEQVALSGDRWDKREVIPSFYTSWREGWLSFSSARLEEMLDAVSRWYNVEIIFVREQSKEILYTGQVRKYEDFREVLNIISLTRSVRFSVDKRTIYVY